MAKLPMRFAYVFTSRLITRFSQFFAVLLLARELSPNGFGAYALFSSTLLLTGQIGNLGIRQSGAAMIGRKQLPEGAVIGSMFLAWVPVSAVCVGLVLLIAPILGGAAAFPPVITVFGVTAILANLLQQGVFLGRGDIRAFSILDAGPRVAQAAIILALAITSTLGVSSSYVGFVLPYVLVLPLGVWLACRSVRAIEFQLTTTLQLIKTGILFAVSIALITLQNRIGVFALSSSVDVGAAGNFFAAQRIAEVCLDLATALGMVGFSDAVRSTDPVAGAKRSLTTALFLFLFFVPVAIGMALVAPTIVAALLGPQYEDASSTIRWIALALPAAAAVRVLNPAVAGHGKPYISAMILVVAVSVNATVTLVEAPYMGIDAASVGLACGHVSAFAIYLLIYRKMLGVSPLTAVRELPDWFESARQKVDRRIRSLVRGK